MGRTEARARAAGWTENDIGGGVMRVRDPQDDVCGVDYASDWNEALSISADQAVTDANIHEIADMPGEDARIDVRQYVQIDMSVLTDRSIAHNVRITDACTGQSIILPAEDQRAANALYDLLLDSFGCQGGPMPDPIRFAKRERCPVCEDSACEVKSMECGR